MTDRPILFSAPMVRALLAGTKTQTRRVLDPWTDEPPAFVLDGVVVARDENDETYRWPRTAAVGGGRLWVREAWRTYARFDRWPPRDLRPGSLVSYEADYDQEPNDGCRGRLRPGMFMPRWASRLTLIVTDVRVQRLQDISEADAIDEGVLSLPPVHASGPPTERGRPPIGGSPIERYAALWNSINGPGAWDENPWIYAISFKVMKVNIDAL